MENKNVILGRRSVREYSPEPLSHELIKEIIDVTRYYPSWKNAQVARFHVVENTETKLNIAENATKGNNTKIITECPTLIVLTYKKGECGTDKNGDYIKQTQGSWEMFDAGIAAQTLSLVAYDKGVGSIILGLFDEVKVAKICSIPEDEQVAALIPIGFPKAEVTKVPPRKAVDDILFFI